MEDGVLEDMTDYFLGRLVGVYVLMQDDTVMYVGQSRNAVFRMTDHRSGLFRDKFNRVLFQRCAEEELDKLEAELIHSLAPLLNRRIPNTTFKVDASQIDQAVVAIAIAKLKDKRIIHRRPSAYAW